MSEQVAHQETLRTAQETAALNQKNMIEKAIAAKAERQVLQIQLGNLRAGNQEATVENIRIGSIAFFGGLLFGIFIGR
jgi:hypothetical protein